MTVIAVIIIAPNVRAELGMSPTNNLKVTCHAFQAWGWSYMSLSRYEGTGKQTRADLNGITKFPVSHFVVNKSKHG